jgi:tetratricopeptide (TPR) repeat protein
MGLRELVRQNPPRRDFRIEHANAALWLATHAEKLGRGETVDAYLAEALDSFERTLIPADCPLEVKYKYADALRFKAQRHVAMSQFHEAMLCAQAALRWYNGVGPNSGNRNCALAGAYHSVAAIYLQCGAEAEALEALERAGELYESSLGGMSRSRGLHLRHSDVWAKLSHLYEESGRQADAFEASRKALMALEAWRGTTPEEPHVAKRLLQLRSNLVRLRPTA